MLASCSEPNLDELKLDYSSEEARVKNLAYIESKLTDEEFNQLMMALANITTAEARRYIQEGNKYSQDEWDEIIDELTKKALHGKSVKELISN